RVRGIHPHRDPPCPRPGAGCPCPVPGQTDLRQCPSNDSRAGAPGQYPDGGDVPLERRHHHPREIQRPDAPIRPMYYLAPINGPTDWMWWAYGLGHAPWEVLLRMGIDITFVVV